MRGAIPPRLQYPSMAWYLVKHRDIFTLPLPLPLRLASITIANLNFVFQDNINTKHSPRILISCFSSTSRQNTKFYHTQSLSLRIVKTPEVYKLLPLSINMDSQSYLTPLLCSRRGLLVCDAV